MDRIDKYPISHQVGVAKSHDAEQVVRWLKREATTGEGFYHSRDIIRRAARQQEMLCARQDRHVVGFGVFTCGMARSAIDVFEIRPGYRHRGIGTLLAKKIIAVLFGRPHRPIRIQCAPASSERFWRKFGFVDDSGKPPSPYLPRLVLHYKDQT